MMDAEYTKRPSFQMIGFTLSTIEIAHKRTIKNTLKQKINIIKI